MLTPEEKIKVARRYLFTRKPFFGSLLAEIDSKQGCHPDPSVPTFRTNGNWIKWNPTFVKGLTVNEIVGVLAHELLHVGLGHTLRRGKRSHHLWQTATDWAINSVLKEDGFVLPEGVLYPPAEQKGKSAESNHDHLRNLYDDRPPTNPNKQPQEEEAESEDDPDNEDSDPDEPSPAPGKDDGEMGEDDGEMEPSDDPSKDETDDDSDAQDDPGSENSDEDEGEDNQDESDDPDAAEDDDGAVDGNGGDADDEDDTPGGKPRLPAPEWGECEDTPGKDGKPMDDVTREKAIREKAIQLVEALRADGESSPSSLRKLAGELIEGKTDWRQVLRQFCNETMKTDTSWRVPNRRFIGQDIYLPGEDGEGLGEQVIVLDTSGSISDKDLKRFQREMRKQLRELPPTKLHIIWHDDKILQHHILEGDYEQIDLSGPGGGGTDFKAVTDYLAEQQIRPRCMVWFTDLETYRWPNDPLIPTLWVVWPCRWGQQVTQAPWGMVNLMPQEEN